MDSATLTKLIVSGILGIFVCAGFWTFLTFLITRSDNKKKEATDASNEIKDQLNKQNEMLEAQGKTLEEFTILIKEIRETDDRQSAVIRAEAHDRICWLGKQYIKRWEKSGTGITAEEYRPLKDLADAYKGIGGNSEAHKVMERVDQIPLIG